MERKILPIEVDEVDTWLISGHFDLKKLKFFGKMVVSYENGEVTNRRFEINDKPPKKKSFSSDKVPPTKTGERVPPTPMGVDGAANLKGAKEE